MYQTILLFCLTVFFAACNQAPTLPVPEKLPLQTVNGKPLPMLLMDQVMQDPGVPPYRFRIVITDGWFKLEGNRYEQSVGFFATAEGYTDQRWRWSEFGTCTQNNDTWRCESGYIQNYVFELKRQSNALITEQAFTDPMLKGTYTFGQ
jgi:hypothetical protein